jgi:cell division protein FtsZ
MGEMGKAMMGTGEASGDNRAIEAAEQAIANPLLDGVSMMGAKGVIISITGGEDMRLMEVDEAASHIKELVDPDANIIWGSAFNNDLQGKIRVSVVATGIGAETSAVQPAPAKVFAFPSAGRAPEAPKVQVAPAAPVAAAPAQPAPAPQQTAPAQPEMTLEEEAPADELTLDQLADDNGDDDGELLLDTGNMVGGEEAPAPQPQQQAPGAGNRSWLNGEASAPAAPRRDGGTLFERMSNIARGAAKAQVDEEPAPGRGTRDPLDIPRFLNRQNNQ